MYFRKLNGFLDVLACKIRVYSLGIVVSDVCARDVVSVLHDKSRGACSGSTLTRLVDAFKEIRYWFYVSTPDIRGVLNNTKQLSNHDMLATFVEVIKLITNK